LFQSKNSNISPAITGHNSDISFGFIDLDILGFLVISDSQESAIRLFTARASKQNEIPGSTFYGCFKAKKPFALRFCIQNYYAQQLNKKDAEHEIR